MGPCVAGTVVVVVVGAVVVVGVGTPEVGETVAVLEAEGGRDPLSRCPAERARASEVVGADALGPDDLASTRP